MANEISTYTYADMERMAGAIAKSGLFGLKTADQALALMAISQAEGLHPATAARDYHIINGRPTLKADAMLARFQQAGGKIVWGKYTDECVSATFSHPAGGTVEVEWTLARAKQAELGGNGMWKKYPRQMLRARVVSEGIRTVYPGVAVGVYTPEEVADMEPQKDRGRINPRPDDMEPMDPELRDQYTEQVGALLDTPMKDLTPQEAARLCLKVREVWDELTSDEQIQVNDRFNTKQKKRLKEIYARKLEDTRAVAEAIDVEVKEEAA